MKSRRPLLLLAIAAFTLLPSLARSEEKEALTVIKAIGESYYDLGEAGLRRAQCYVSSKEIQDTLDVAARNVIRLTKFEAILEPGGKFEVKPRDISPRNGPAVRAGIHLYAAMLQKYIAEVDRILKFIPNIMKPKLLDSVFDVSYEKAGDESWIVLESKRKEKVTLPPKENGGEPVVDLKAAEAYAITLDKKGMLSKIRKISKDGTEETNLKLQVKDGKWAIKEMDYSKFDKQERLMERTIIQVKFTTKSGLMLPAKITLKAVDKKGKAIDRRDEPNPLTMTFTDYEIEERE
ncbi:MAG: hypothetical protein JXR97_02145 [Planctomycetes bacterium]|nr:hypothetical protein [Planctomycetota bacterium]